MKLRMSLYDAVTEADMSAKSTDLETALQHLTELSPVEGSYIGFDIGDDDGNIQFVYQENGNLLVDVPDEERGGSLQKTADFDECEKIIRSLYKDTLPENIPGLKFVEW